MAATWWHVNMKPSQGTKLYCLVNRGTWVLTTCPELSPLQCYLRDPIRHASFRSGGACLRTTLPHYIRQVNGVKLADILFSLLCVCLSVSVCLWALSPVFNLADICTLWAPSSFILIRCTVAATANCVVRCEAAQFAWLRPMRLNEVRWDKVGQDWVTFVTWTIPVTHLVASHCLVWLVTTMANCVASQPRTQLFIQ